MKKAVLSAFFLLAAVMIWSDTSVRPATDKEKAAVKQFKELCMTILPDGPEGWTETSRTDSSLPTHVPKDIENDLYSLSYHITWVDRVNKKAGNEAALGAVEETLEKSKNPDEEKLLVRQEKLSAEFAAAIQSGDMEKAQKIKNELEINSQELKKAFSQQDQAISSAIEQNLIKDTEMNVRIRTNDTRQELPSGAHRQEPIQGFQVWRLREGKMLRGEWQEGTTLILKGKWAPDEKKENVLMAEADKSLSHLCIQTMRILVQAENSRARNYLEKIDWKTLTAIID